MGLGFNGTAARWPGNRWRALTFTILVVRIRAVEPIAVLRVSLPRTDSIALGVGSATAAVCQSTENVLAGG